MPPLSQPGRARAPTRLGSIGRTCPHPGFASVSSHLALSHHFMVRSKYGWEISHSQAPLIFLQTALLTRPWAYKMQHLDLSHPQEDRSGKGFVLVLKTWSRPFEQEISAACDSAVWEGRAGVWGRQQFSAWLLTTSGRSTQKGSGAGSYKGDPLAWD